jgi:hypothetical protein
MEIGEAADEVVDGRTAGKGRGAKDALGLRAVGTCVPNKSMKGLRSGLACRGCEAVSQVNKEQRVLDMQRL